MKLSINKLLIGFLFVFSFILIPTDVARANTYTATCGTFWVNYDLNVTVNSPMSLTASGGMGGTNGCISEGIEVYARSDQDGIDRILFSGSFSSYLGGAITFSTGINKYITFTVISLPNANQNNVIFLGQTRYVVLPEQPPAVPLAVTVYAQNMTIAGSQKLASALTVPYNTSVRISWTPSSNATHCNCTYLNNGITTSCGEGVGNGEVFGNTLTLAQSKTFSVKCDDN